MDQLPTILPLQPAAIKVNKLSSIILSRALLDDLHKMRGTFGNAHPMLFDHLRQDTARVILPCNIRYTGKASANQSNSAPILEGKKTTYRATSH
jgi:hypothetical protein